MRRNAGSFITNKLLEKGILWIAALCVCAGGVIGSSMDTFVVLLTNWNDWAILGVTPSFVVFVPAVLILFFGRRIKSKWSFDNLSKGSGAELEVGQKVEYAVTDRRCAVAHSVTSIAAVGDIDHLVVTPTTVWVIETKYQILPRRVFGKTLRHIAYNVKSVRRWIDDLGAQEVQVKGCLVFEKRPRVNQTLYDSEGEEIHLYYQSVELAKAIRSDLMNSGKKNDNLIRAVWKLGAIVET